MDARFGRKVAVETSRLGLLKELNDPRNNTNPITGTYKKGVSVVSCDRVRVERTDRIGWGASAALRLRASMLTLELSLDFHGPATFGRLPKGYRAG